MFTRTVDPRPFLVAAAISMVMVAESRADTPSYMLEYADGNRISGVTLEDVRDRRLIFRSEDRLDSVSVDSVAVIYRHDAVIYLAVFSAW